MAHDPDRIVFTYMFFGSPHGEPINLQGLKAAKKSFNKRQAAGEFGKAERPNHFRAPHSKFSKPMSIVALAVALFGEEPAEQSSLGPH